MLELLKTSLGSKITQEVKHATAHLNGSFFEEDDKSNASDHGGAGG